MISLRKLDLELENQVNQLSGISKKKMLWERKQKSKNLR